MALTKPLRDDPSYFRSTRCTSTSGGGTDASLARSRAVAAFPEQLPTSQPATLPFAPYPTWTFAPARPVAPPKPHARRQEHFGR